MKTLNFSTDFDENLTRSRFVVHNDDIKPTHVYRHDLTKFEFRELICQNTRIVYKFDIHEIIEQDEDIQLQFTQHFFIEDKVYFLVATQTTDRLESFLYFLNPWSGKLPALKRILFTKSLKGQITNIFVSKKFKNASSNKENYYYVLTIGTLDSALYVIRFTRSDFLPKKDIMDKVEDKNEEEKATTTKVFSCALLRTDARNAISQEIVVLNNDNQAKTPPKIYIICAGSNGILDFFLLKSDANIAKEPNLLFQRHNFIELPSKLPIVSLQCLKSDNKQILLAVGQQLLKPLRISRLLEPSMTILKLNIKNLLCKDKVSMKFPNGTHILPLRSSKLWGCFSDLEATRVTWSEFVADTFTFGEKHNIFMDLPQATSQPVQQVYMDTETCWILGSLQLTQSTVKSTKRHKRQLSP